MAKSSRTKSITGRSSSDSEKVADYMDKLRHPLKDEMEAVRIILKNANPELNERIKWNAPSYHYKNEDLVTFNPRALKQVHRVFHHPAIVKIKSPILEGDYDGRRMVYFNNMKEIKARKKELEKVMDELVRTIDRTQARARTS